MHQRLSQSSLRESVIEAELVRQVTALGGECPKVTVIGKRGFFDRLAILPGGRVIFIETKRPRGGRISPHQQQLHVKYAALGVEVAVIRNMSEITPLLFCDLETVKP